MAARIHPSAVVEQGARLASGVVIGPYCVVGSGVVLEKNTLLHAHCVVGGATRVGEACQLFPFSVVGGPPQDRKHREEEMTSKLEIGRGCIIREHATINGGSSSAKGLTRIGANTMVLTGSHVGHDCRVGNGVVISNNVQLAGHVNVGDFATIGGATSIRQFVNIGRLSMTAGASAVDKHVVPYSVVQGNRAELKGVNIVGLRRRGVDSETTRVLQSFFRSLGQRERMESEEPLAEIVGKWLGGWKTPDREKKPNLLMLEEVAAFLLAQPYQGTEELYDWDWKHKKLGHTLCL